MWFYLLTAYRRKPIAVPVKFAVRARTGQFAFVVRCAHSELIPNIRNSRSVLTDSRGFIVESRQNFQRELTTQALRRYSPLFCLTAERLIRGGTKQGDALFPRASPLKKSPTGAFFNSPLAEGFSCKSVSRSAERDQRLCLWKLPPLKRRAKLCRSVSHEFLPGASYEASQRAQSGAGGAATNANGLRRHSAAN